MPLSPSPDGRTLEARVGTLEHPAILTGTHEAEAGSRSIAEFGLAQFRHLREHRHQEGVSLQSIAADTVDFNFDDLPILLGNTDKASNHHTSQNIKKCRPTNRRRFHCLKSACDMRRHLPTVFRQTGTELSLNASADRSPQWHRSRPDNHDAARGSVRPTAPVARRQTPQHRSHCQGCPILPASESRPIGLDDI